MRNLKELRWRDFRHSDGCDGLRVDVSVAGNFWGLRSGGTWRADAVAAYWRKQGKNSTLLLIG